MLAGADTAPTGAAPVTLVDLLRAAQSRIQDYPRVEYVRDRRRRELVPEAAVDGSCTCSPSSSTTPPGTAGPDRPVSWRPAGRRRRRHRVADRGPGLDPPPRGDQRPTSRTRRVRPPTERAGLAVVARLAARHGLDVTLQPAPGSDGLVATVRLPSSLLCQAAPVPVEPAPVGPEPKVSTPVAPAPAVPVALAPTVPVVSPSAVPVTPAPVARVDRPLPPRVLERSPALPGGEPMDIPHPRKDAGRLPVVRGGVAADGPTVEARAFDDGLPRRTVGPSPHVDPTPVESDDVSTLLSTYQHAIGRFGAVPVPVNQEGHSSS